MWKLIFLLLLILTNKITFSQINDPIYKIYLKDGTIVKGKLSNSNKEHELIISLNDSTHLYIAEKTVKKTKLIKGCSKINSELISNDFQEKGFYNITSIGINGGIRENQTSSLGVHINSTTGYMFSRYFGTGLGFGIDKFDYEALLNPMSDPFIQNVSPITNSIPVFLEIRGYFYGKQTAYYYSLNAGYGFVNKNEALNVYNAKGGMMWYPALGIRFGNKKHFNVCLDLGLKFQRMEYIVPILFDEGHDQYNMNYKRFILRVGIQI